MQPSQFASFREFYPYYLQQHTNRTSRRLHVAGTLLALAVAIAAAAAGRWGWLLAAPLIAQERPGLFFREDWKETPAETPVTQAHVANPNLILSLYGMVESFALLMPDGDGLGKHHQ